MKLIWNEEPTAPEAPFFAAPQAEEELEPLDEEEGDDSQACSWRGQGFGS